MAESVPGPDKSEPEGDLTLDPRDLVPQDSCEVCGSQELAYVHCKVICRNCHSILRTCSDL
jgi:hypothetical protein